MKPLSNSASDADLIRFVDEWATLLEREEYDAAFAHTDHVAQTAWTPALMREVIKAYGRAHPHQKVTRTGRPSDVVQRKEVTWWKSTRPMGSGEIWYDLNIDGVASDLTATFWLVRDSTGIKVVLNDIHVM